MAYFERGDEANQLVFCNICNVKCRESSLTVHKAKCCEKPDHKKRFDKDRGDLQKCQYDTSHIIKGDNMSIHLEFCSKYQDKMVAEYQAAIREARGVPEPEPQPPSGAAELYELDDSWNREANSEPFIRDLSRLKI